MAEQPAEEANTVDAIVVTAQRREQSLQDVPVVVTAVSEQTLEDAGVRDIKDLQIVVPGLTVTSTSSETSTTARIRGVGTVGDNPGLESSVGITIDGVYRPRNGVGFNDLGELTAWRC
jgi:outer membrane receptor protein involved in Fe transport